ncbi:MAG: HYR domain-containing protein [Methylomicrobium sp.]
MNTTSTQNKLKWAVCLAACLPYASVNAVPQYGVSDLGTLEGTYSLGLGVNNSGLTIGFSYLPDNVSEHAILGQYLTLPKDLGTLGGISSQAFGINNLGQVVGSASLSGDNFYHAFQWDGGVAPPLAALKDLGALVNPGYSRAFSVNDNGQATGFSSTSTGTEHAVIWDKTGAIRDLGTLDGTGNSHGIAINLSGQVAGFSNLTGNKSPHAVVWGINAKKDMGTLGGTYSAAYAINTTGEVAGVASTALNGAQHAFLWQPSQVPLMKDLGTLGGNFSEGYGISDAGDVVGYSTTVNDAAEKAFLWQNGIGIQDLNTLIDPASGWTLLEAHAISEDGTYITGIGTFNGERHAFLLKRQVSDTTPPKVSFLITPAAPSASGWYLTAPSVVWTVTDPESAISSKVGCTDVPSMPNTAPAGQTYSCAATSAGGTAATVTTPSLKVDTTQPAFAGVPAAFTQAATSLAGTVVNYTAPTASDASSGVSAAGVSCAPASGSTLPMGPTTVNCSVKDNAGNSNSASFVVTVADTTVPTIACPAAVNVVQGQAITLGNASASDNIGVTALTNNAPASYPIGTTTVTWTAADAAGNLTSCAQPVTVTTAPVTPPTISETISVTKAQCKRSTTSGEWLVQGTTSIATNNSVQLYSTASVPADLTSNKLGTAVPDAKGQWQFQAKPGPVCATPISLRSAGGKVLVNIGVSIP